MIDLLTNVSFLSLLIKFMVASTLLLGTVWLLEKIKILTAPDLAELAWKLAIAGSFAALLPIGDWISAPITIENGRTAELARQFNEGQPLRTVVPSGSSGGDRLQTPNQTTGAATVQTRGQNSGQTLGQTSGNTSGNTPGQEASLPNAVPLLAPAPALPNLMPQSSETKTRDTSDTKGVPTLTSPSGESTLVPPTETAQQNQNPVTNSETLSTVGKTDGGPWQSLASLRTKDLIFTAWLALALVAALFLIAAYTVAVKALGSRVRVTAEDDANRTLREICEKADIKHVPYLSRSSDLKSPVCLPRREICLPDWAFDDLPREELRSLLAHELGHMVRRDPLMLMALQMLSRLFFFQPLFILARKRLTDLAELAADEWAAQQLADARSVAAALYTCATKIHENRQIQWGLAMAGNKSMLKTRVERLLGGNDTVFKKSSRLAKGTIAAGVLAVTLGMPSIQFAGALSAGHPHEFDIQVPHIEPDRELMAELERLQVEHAKALRKIKELEYQEVARLKEELDEIGATKKLNIERKLKNAHSISRTRSVLNRAIRRDNKALSAEEQRKIDQAIDASQESLDQAQDILADEIANVGGRMEEVAERISETTRAQFYDSEEWASIEAAAEAHAAAVVEQVESQVAGLTETHSRHHVRERSGLRRSIESHDGRGNMVWSDNGYTISANWDGRFTLSDDDTSIVNITPNGEVKIETKGRGPKRKIRIENDNGDDLETRYWVNGKRQDLDQAGEKWLAETLQLLVRETGLNAADRVQRMLDAGGPDAVLKEMSKIKSDYVLRLYSGQLIDLAELEDKQAYKLIGLIEKMDSDYDLRLALTHMFSAIELDGKAMPRVLKAAKTIESDYELRLLLSPFIDQFGVTDKSIDMILDLAARMESDYEMRLLLTLALDEADDLNKKQLERFTKIATSQIESDYELRLLLSTMADQYDESKDATKLIIDSLGRLESDYEKRLLLSMIVDNGSFDNKLWVDAIKAAGNIASDYEKRLVLSEIQDNMPEDKDIKKAFDAAVKTISSDYERERLATTDVRQTAASKSSASSSSDTSATASASASASARGSANR